MNHEAAHLSMRRGKLICIAGRSGRLRPFLITRIMTHTKGAMDLNLLQERVSFHPSFYAIQ